MPMTTVDSNNNNNNKEKNNNNNTMCLFQTYVHRTYTDIYT